MGTSGFRDRERGGIDGGLGPQRVGRGLGLAGSALLLGFGCLDMIGDVNVNDGIRTDIRPIKAGGDMDCPDAGLSAGACIVRCEPGLPRCADNLLQRCNEAGDGWVLVDQCASAALCDAALVQCGAPLCSAGEYRCTTDGQLQLCRADRTDFELVRQCTSAAYCTALPGRARCEDVPCRPGRQRCNGPQIEVCREDRSGFDVLGAACASAALCVEGETASCQPPTCAPGTFICEGALLSRCSDDANRYIPINQCASPDLCVAAQQRCAEPACVVGAQRCTGNVLERCNAAQDGYTGVDVCGSAAQCDPTAPACLTTTPPSTTPDPSVLDGDDYDFVEASSSAVLGLGPMTLRVPEQWSDVDRSAWTSASGAAIGPRFIASTDSARFARNFDIPGVFFAATEAEPVDVAARQNEFDLSGRCSDGGREEYEDDLYIGTVQTWTDCGTTNATTSVVVAVDKEGARFVTVVIVTMTAERDEAALDEIWDSFIVD